MRNIYSYDKFVDDFFYWKAKEVRYWCVVITTLPIRTKTLIKVNILVDSQRKWDYKRFLFWWLVRLPRFELGTSTLSVLRSNQLSYNREFVDDYGG